MRLLPLPAILFVVATGMAAAGRPAVTAAATSPVKSCGTITGPNWKDPVSPSFRGNKYDVRERQYSCSRAVSYVRKLVTERPTGNPRVQLAGGPAGWRCVGNPSTTGLAYQGTCTPKNQPVGGPWINWSGHS